MDLRGDHRVALVLGDIVPVRLWADLWAGLCNFEAGSRQLFSALPLPLPFSLHTVILSLDSPRRGKEHSNRTILSWHLKCSRIFMKVGTSMHAMEPCVPVPGNSS